MMQSCAADVPYPQRKYQQMGLKAGQIFWYRAQLVDRTGNESVYRICAWPGQR
jgi:predicted phage tail protein